MAREARDNQKRKIYDWEMLYIRPADDEQLTEAEIRALCHDIASAYGLHTPVVSFILEKTDGPRYRGVMAKFVHGGGRGGTVKIPRWGRTRPVVCHEMAHCIEWQFDGRSASHGKLFAGIFLNLLNKYSRIPLPELRRTARIHKIDWALEREQPVMKLHFHPKRSLCADRTDDFKLPEFVENHHKENRIADRKDLEDVKRRAASKQVAEDDEGPLELRRLLSIPIR